MMIKANDRKRVCLLTGASGRLGTRFCTLFADRYDIVAVHRRRPVQVPSQQQVYVDPLDVSRALAVNAHSVFAIRSDIADEKEASRIVDLAVARFGLIDLVVNAAVHSVWSPMLASSALIDSMRLQLGTNIFAPLHLGTAVARRCWTADPDANRRAGRNIVNISSLAGAQIFAGTGQSVYAATKAALNHLTWHMADEFQAIGVRVNALAPDSFPRRLPTDRVARAIASLDQDQRTGEVIAMTADADLILPRPSLATARPAALVEPG